ncbi:hypothetical protein DPMN_114024, partial [Dreissena polymorpha]
VGRHFTPRLRDSRVWRYTAQPRTLTKNSILSKKKTTKVPLYCLLRRCNCFEQSS